MAWAFNVDVNIVQRSIIMLGEHNHVGLHPFMAILVNRKHHILLHLQSDNLIMTPPHILEFYIAVGLLIFKGRGRPLWGA